MGLQRGPLNDTRRFILFSLKIHLKPWYNTHNAIKAPSDDLNTLKALNNLLETIPITAQAALHKMKNHLWYLSTTMAALSFFDPDVSSEIKLKMLRNIYTVDSRDEDLNRAFLGENVLIENISLDHFVTKDTMRFFNITGINTDFFTEHPDHWSQSEDFIRAQNAANLLSVINDAAERSIALYQHCKDNIQIENQKKCLLQFTESQRKATKKLRKSDIPFCMDSVAVG